MNAGKNNLRRGLVLIGFAVIGAAGWWLGSRWGSGSTPGKEAGSRADAKAAGAPANSEKGKDVPAADSNLTGKRDFAAEWDAALAQPNVRDRNGQIYRLCDDWAKVDPRAALSKALQTMEQRGPETRESLSNSALLGIFTMWARHHGWASAHAAALGMKDARFRDQALRQIAQEAASNPDGTAGNMTQLLTIPEASTRVTALESALRAWSIRDAVSGDAAMEWLATLPPDNLSAAERSRLELAAANGMLTRDPRGAAEWMLERAPAEQRGQQLAQIVGLWATTAPNACGEWLNSRLKGAETDAAVEQFVHQAARHDPESAYHWAAKITDPKVRERTSAWALRTWTVSDPEAARRVREAAAAAKP